MLNKKGFTLVELLVVVLIIGILATIGLPQYTRSVEKSRSSEAVLNLKNVADAMIRYYTIKGMWDKNDNIKSMFDIELNGGTWSTGENLNKYTTPNFRYEFDCTSSSTCVLDALRENVEEKEKLYGLRYTLTNGKVTARECYNQKYDIGRTICTSMESFGYTQQEAVLF
ncbi:prepilin-type N-terminal cleavage/methylation domain-containing protein [Elusimicrobium simillimum]